MLYGAYNNYIVNKVSKRNLDRDNEYEFHNPLNKGH